MVVKVFSGIQGHIWPNVSSPGGCAFTTGTKNVIKTTKGIVEPADRMDIALRKNEDLTLGPAFRGGQSPQTRA